MRLLQNVVIEAHHQETLNTKAESQKNHEGQSGKIFPDKEHESTTELRSSFKAVTVGKDNIVPVLDLA